MRDDTARLYLDHNASAPMLPQARTALAAALDAANPSSVHREGRAARALVESARRSVAGLVGAAAENVLFTSGATEAAATSLSPSWLIDGQPIALTRLAVLDTDHASIREGGAFAPDSVTRLPVDAHGAVVLDALSDWASTISSGETGLLALCLANSETGVVQDLETIRAILAGASVRLVLDVVQAVGRLPVNVADMGADALILSGHKLGAAKGIGALVLADPRTRPFAMIRGGGQEKGRRGGTEAVPAIASLGAAADVLRTSGPDAAAFMKARRAGLERMLGEAVPGAVVLGSGTERLANTVAIALPGLKAETAQIGLDLAGIAVSAGSACSSGKVGRSHVVEAMARGGLAVSPDDGAIRVSFGPETTEAELERLVSAYARLAERALRAAAQERAA
ncbi:cysteine desulfurase family protein [Aurantimonas sp. VKM B-3413]|uniref:cysteine desulfurase family protein n=1 Tax=Aurantimonas sp. VKM B-3413 TaxID=2779401 RepID=UPI001E569BCA|nr:cysteine desulfurase family protein [Aurantimonas sp. VKM B-3413]MCB8839867.1 cysteine desulfurase [Aurantimonas sp. VKM B-3413]